MNKIDLNNDRAILNDFLKTWSLERVREMSLDEYVNIENPETFCQHVENKTRSLGSIRGGQSGSLKFGIYRRKNVTVRPKNANSDDTHSWQTTLKEDDKLTAFEKVKSNVIEVIIAAQRLDFERIENIHLFNNFKWKVAFLYSNEGFIPIYKKEALHLIAKDLGLKITNKTKYSEVHMFIASTKPSGISVYDYMRRLYSEYRIEQETGKKEPTKRRKSRKGTKKRNTKSQHRKGSGEYVADQFHNELQEKLETYLTEKFGELNVILEENYVDVKVTLPNEIHYYEVKTAGFAEDCIRQGIGQLLSYAHFENDKRKKQLIIFGKNKPNISENTFIDFVKSKFNDIEFNYLSLSEIENI